MPMKNKSLDIEIKWPKFDNYIAEEKLGSYFLIQHFIADFFLLNKVFSNQKNAKSWQGVITTSNEDISDSWNKFFGSIDRTPNQKFHVSFTKIEDL